MATYLELKAKAEKMLAEAELLRQKEMNDVVSDIKEKIKAYGLTAQDLGLAGAPRARKGTTPNAKSVKYRSPSGETWSGGRGRKPAWVVEALKAGKNMDDFAA